MTTGPDTPDRERSAAPAEGDPDSDPAVVDPVNEPVAVVNGAGDDAAHEAGNSEGAGGNPDGEQAEAPPPSTKRRKRGTRAQRALVEWGLVIVGALVVVIVVRTFLFQAFYIPSGSMEPTLKNGDRVLVNKLSYHLHAVHRGDIVVFDRPKCDRSDTPTWAQCDSANKIKDLIKRVVGLPGDTIIVKDHHVYVDGRLLKESYTHGLPTDPICQFGQVATEGYKIPKDDVFVMGDNRTNSTDSRCFGPIPKSLIVGRAFVRVWPLSRLGFL